MTTHTFTSQTLIDAQILCPCSNICNPRLRSLVPKPTFDGGGAKCKAHASGADLDEQGSRPLARGGDL